MEVLRQYLMHNPTLAALLIGLPIALILSALIVFPRPTKEFWQMMLRLLLVVLAGVAGVIVQSLRRPTIVALPTEGETKGKEDPNDVPRDERLPE